MSLKTPIMIVVVRFHEGQQSDACVQSNLFTQKGLVCISNLILGVILEGSSGMSQVCSEMTSSALLGPKPHFEPIMSYPAKPINCIYLYHSVFLYNPRNHGSIRYFCPALCHSFLPLLHLVHMWYWEEIKKAGLGWRRLVIYWFVTHAVRSPLGDLFI